MSFCETICLSGGAEGADLYFGTKAAEAGHDVIHWSFEGARTRAPKHQLAILDAEQLREADFYLSKANQTLKRRLPFHRPWIANLLRRNWYQVKDSSSVYAVATIEKDGLVSGGTSWAIQLYLDRVSGGWPCPCYVFDQHKGHWLAWEGSWQPIVAPPTPTGIWAGIGSRDLREAGKRAIDALLECPVRQ